MTSPLREALDDLVADVPAHVVTEDLGSRAWVAGRRRRVRRGVGNSMIAVGMLAVLTIAVVPLARDRGPQLADGGASSSTVGGYPQRIGHQWWTSNLPARPGPVAAVAEVMRSGNDEQDGWYAVAEDGHLWRLPLQDRTAADIYPTVSPDGRRIGYLPGNAGPYVIHDLVTGQKVTFPQIGSGNETARTPYWAEMQTPSFWAPDRRRLVLFAGRRTAEGGGALVLGVDGSLTSVTPPGTPVGWVDDSTLAWLDGPVGVTPAQAQQSRLVVHVTDAAGSPRRSVQLRPSTPWEAEDHSQWTGRVSSDGKQILMLDGGSGTTLVRRFSLADGRETTRPVQVADVAVPCGHDSAGTTPILTANNEERGAATVAVRGNTTSPLTVTEPRTGIRCLVWASGALDAGPHWNPFGTTTWWWTWWWREIGAVLLVAVTVVWAYRRVQRRFPHLAARRRPPNDPADVDWWA